MRHEQRTRDAVPVYRQGKWEVSTYKRSLAEIEADLQELLNVEDVFAAATFSTLTGGDVMKGVTVVARGKRLIVGHVENGVYHKAAKSCYQPRGFAFSGVELDQAKRRGATRVEIVDKRDGRKWRIPLADVSGPSVDFGYGPQIVAPMARWSEVPPGGQLPLFAARTSASLGGTNA